MFYILNERYRLRGWHKVPYVIFDTTTKSTLFLSKDKFSLIAKCNGFHTIDIDALSEELKKFFHAALENEIIRPASLGNVLLP